MEYRCSKCNVSGVKLWRPGGTSNYLLCEEHLQEKNFMKPSDMKLGFLNNKLVEYFPAVQYDESPLFYPPNIIPKDKYNQWKNMYKKEIFS